MSSTAALDMSTSVGVHATRAPAGVRHGVSSDPGMFLRRA